jgi:hypothetical protein
MYKNKKTFDTTNMEMTQLDQSSINFIYKANLIFVSKDSEDRDSRIPEISGIELPSIGNSIKSNPTRCNN